MSRIMRFIILVLAIIPAFSSPAFGSESAWQKFTKIKDRFYYIDKQKFTQLSCKIDVPIMVKLINQIKKELAPLHDKIGFKANLSTFALTYSPEFGLRFSDPGFVVTLNDKNTMADRERVKQGINEMKTGFSMQVHGIKNVINSLVEDSSYPQKEKYKNLLVTKTRDGFVVKYMRDDKHFVETYRNNTVKTLATGDSVTIKTNQNYTTTIYKKLTLKNASVSISQPMSHVKGQVSIKSQYLGNIVFPKRIEYKFEQTIQSISQQGIIDINLKNCKIK